MLISIHDPIPNACQYHDLGVLVDTSLKFHLHIREVYGKAVGVASSILRGTLCHSSEFMAKIFVTHVRPIIDYASVVWNTGFIGDVQLLERIQRYWTKRIDGLRELSYDQRLQHLELFSIKGDC